MMELDGFDKKDLILIINNVESGMSLAESMKSFVPSNLGDVITTLHSLYCTEMHTGAEGENFCGFYNETDWVSPAHLKWLALFNRIFEKCESDTATITRMLKYVLDVEEIKDEVFKVEGEKGLLLLNTLLKLPNIE